MPCRTAPLRPATPPPAAGASPPPARAGRARRRRRRPRRAVPALRAARDLPGGRLRACASWARSRRCSTRWWRARRAAGVLSADLAPPDVLELLAAWLGVELDESWPERARARCARAADPARWRGTRPGLELALRIAFPHCRCASRTGGDVHAPDDTKRAAAARGFVVYCDEPISDEPDRPRARDRGTEAGRRLLSPAHQDRRAQSTKNERLRELQHANADDRDFCRVRRVPALGPDLAEPAVRPTRPAGAGEAARRSRLRRRGRGAPRRSPRACS